STEAVESPASLRTKTSLLRVEASGVGPGVENSVGQPFGVEQPRVVDGPVITSAIGERGIVAPAAVLLIVAAFGVFDAFGAVCDWVSFWSMRFVPSRPSVVPNAWPFAVWAAAQVPLPSTIPTTANPMMKFRIIPLLARSPTSRRRYHEPQLRRRLASL